MTWASARNIVERTGKSYDDAVAALARMNPGGRLIDPDEVADAVCALVADATSNGATVVLDGGERSSA
jgi:NAD(P)-dependent dehydrogenase (short-subunit alcohol dehydrogenase family)